MLRTIIFFLQQAGYIAPTVEAGVTALFLSFSSIFTLLLYFGPKFYLLKHGDAAATRNASRFGSNVSCWESANAPTGISGQRSANYSYNVAAPRSTAISSTEEEEEAPAATTVVRFSGVTEPGSDARESPQSNSPSRRRLLTTQGVSQRDIGAFLGDSERALIKEEETANDEIVGPIEEEEKKEAK